jgi:hypothetical protein
MQRKAQRGSARLGLIAVLFVLMTLAAVGATAASGRGSGSCGALDGKYENGAWVGGIAAPGITVQSASGQQIVFALQDGFTLTDLCVKTGRELNHYEMDTTLPEYGPETITVSRSGSGFGLGSISFDTEVTPPCAATPPDVTFGEPTFISTDRAGGEPVSQVAQDGSITVSAHAGTTHIYKSPDALPGVRDFLGGYTNQTLNWRSTDGGETWKYTGFAGGGEGPHSAASTGFSDPDYAMDQAGNIYNVEIDLANDAVYKSVDDGQSWPISVPVAAPGDRPWLTALEPNEVFLYVNAYPKAMYVSRDPNLLQWSLISASPPVTSKSVPDPLNPDDGMIGPVGLGRFAISGDDAQTWTTHDFGPLGKARQFFGVVAVDNSGNVYQAAAGGYNGSADDGNPATELHDGEVTFTYYERATGETNTEKLQIPAPDGDALWPWVIAGDDGRVAVVWYQRLANEPNHFYIYAAITDNAYGKVKCADGSVKSDPPKWTVVNVSKRPVHIGKICLDGTTCNANTSFEAGDRRLGDFFTVNYDLNGDLIIASGDTTLPNPQGGPKPVGNPIFMRQIAGDRMLAAPIQPRPTRPLSDPVVISPPRAPLDEELARELHEQMERAERAREGREGELEGEEEMERERELEGG